MLIATVTALEGCTYTPAHSHAITHHLTRTLTHAHTGPPNMQTVGAPHAGEPLFPGQDLYRAGVNSTQVQGLGC